MNTITIDQSVYEGAALYARQNNISIQQVIEQGVKLLLENVRLAKPQNVDIELEEAFELEEALKYVSTLSAKGGRPVPANEDGRDARIEKFM